MVDLAVALDTAVQTRLGTALDARRLGQNDGQHRSSSE